MKLVSDIMVIIFEHLPFTDLLVCRSVCVEWKDIIYKHVKVDIQSCTSYIDINKGKNIIKNINVHEIDCEITKDAIIYTVNGLYHRNDGPAIICKNGLIFFYRDGILYRNDGPAKIYLKNIENNHITDIERLIASPSTSMKWYCDDKLHIINREAIICENGLREWWEYDKRYRYCGPAIINN
jgi:hypothetical protein